MYLLEFDFSGGSMMDEFLQCKCDVVKWSLCILHVKEVRRSKGFMDVLILRNARTSTVRDTCWWRDSSGPTC